MAHAAGNSQMSSTDAAWLPLVQHLFDDDCVAIEDLDRKLASIHEYEILAKQKRNARVGACKLPPEIVGEILSFAHALWPPRRIERAVEKPYGAGWMSLTHVCSFWRKVAIALPALWQNVNILDVHPNYSNDILTRSARRPLRLSSRADLRFVDTDAHVMLAERIWLNASVLHRVEELELRCGKISSFAIQALTQPTPAMRVLDISSRRYCVLPPNLLNSDTDPCQLRELRIVGCALPPDTRLLASNLVHLDLGYGRIALKDHHITTAHMLQAISIMTALESIQLHDVPRPANGHDADTPLSHVNLPDVFNSLNIEVSDTAFLVPLAELMEHLSVPPTTALYVLMYVEDVDVQTLMQCHRLVEVMKRYRAHYSSPLELSIIEPEYHLRPVGAGSSLTGFSQILSIAESNDVMYSLLPTFSYTHVVSLLLEDPALLGTMHQVAGENPWTESFSSALSVESLTTCFSRSDKLWPALYQPGSNLFPKLETIIVLEPTTLRDLSDELSKSTLRPIALDMIKAVELRRTAETPIREVKMPESMSGWDVWGPLRSLVKVTTL
ncbi:unnamed protein product [Peniophora sp. CBMAI 1063]|nr:unnamed protein product [Peniophora sp. CBMAI 1063]